VDAGTGKHTTTVNANIAASWVPLHSHLEVVDFFGLEDQAHDRGRVGEALVDGSREIALQAARVVGQAVAVVGGRAIGQSKCDGPKIDGHVHERAAGHATAAGAVREDDLRKAGAAQHNIALAGDVCAVAGHGSSGAVKDGRFLSAGLSCLGPVPVRLVASVAAFVAESLLVRPGEVAVPGQEGTLEVSLTKAIAALQ